MVMQYRKKEEGAHWRDYPGKKKIEGNPEKYDFRLLTQDKKKVLVESASYDKVLRRMRQIEFFKHRKGMKRLSFRFFDSY
jgi:hypothetical protein